MIQRLEHNLSRLNPWFVFAIFAALTFLIYALSLENQFLAGDEETIILKNVFLTDWKYFFNFFTENYKAGAGENSNYYRPVQMILSFLLVQTTGYDPLPFHIVSLLFHAGCAFFLYRLLREFVMTKISALVLFMGALLWLTHPTHNEEMAVASGVASSTHLFFMLLGMFSFLKFTKSGSKCYFILAMFANVCAVLSKESAIVFPGLLLGVHLVYMNLHKTEKKPAQKVVLWHLPFWVITLGYVALRLTLLNFDNTMNFYKTKNPFTESFLVRLFTFSTVILQQIKIFFLPTDLHNEREWPVHLALTPHVMLGLATLILLIVAFFYFWKRSPFISLAIGWFLGAYVPMSNLFARINAIIWDHWLYTPSVGIVILLLYMSSKCKRAAALVLLGVPTLVFGSMTFVRGPIWYDTESISRYILQHEPESVKTMTNLAIAVAEKGRNDEAIEWYKKGIALNDVWPQAHHNLAVQYAKVRNFADAKVELRKAIEMQADFYYSMNLLGGILYEEGNKKEAFEWYRRSLKVYPHQETIQRLIDGEGRNYQ